MKPSGATSTAATTPGSAPARASSSPRPPPSRLAASQPASAAQQSMQASTTRTPSTPRAPPSPSSEPDDSPSNQVVPPISTLCCVRSPTTTVWASTQPTKKPRMPPTIPASSTSTARAKPPTRRSSRGDHLLLDADAGGDGALVLQRHRRGVLQGDARGVEDRDLILALAALELAADDLADLAGDVVLGDRALAQRDVDLAVLAALADVVDEDAGALQDARVELLLAGEVRPER